MINSAFIALGTNVQRTGLEQCIQALKAGDTLIIYRFDRLGRSMHHKSICDGEIDTTTSFGELIFNIFSALVQFERQLIQERTRAGLEAARARGRVGGRKKIEKDNPKVVMAKKMHQNHNMEINDICKTLKIARATFYRYLRM